MYYKRVIMENTSNRFQSATSIFEGTNTIYRDTHLTNPNDIDSFTNTLQNDLIDFIPQLLSVHPSYSVSLDVTCEYTKERPVYFDDIVIEGDNDEVDTTFRYIITPYKIITKSSTNVTTITNIIKNLSERMENMSRTESGFKFSKVTECKLIVLQRAQVSGRGRRSTIINYYVCSKEGTNEMDEPGFVTFKDAYDLLKTKTIVPVNIKEMVTKLGDLEKVKRSKVKPILLAIEKNLSMSTFIRDDNLPISIANKQSTLNIKNKDNYCFLRCIIADKELKRRKAVKKALKAKSELTEQEKVDLKDINKPRITFMNMIEPLAAILDTELVNDDYTNVTSSVQVRKTIKSAFFDQSEGMTTSNIQSFAKEYQHPINVYCLVYHKGNYNVSPIHVSENFDSPQTTDLLLYKGHYYLITNFNGLIYCSNKHKGKSHACRKCLTTHSTKKTLQEHVSSCKNKDCYKVQMPEKGEHTSFRPLNKALKHPLVVYADCESILTPSNEFTNETHRHIPSAFGAYCVYRGDLNLIYEDSPIHNYANRYFQFNGVNSGHKFMTFLKTLEAELVPVFKKCNKMDPLTDDEQMSYDLSEKCHICGKPFTDPKKNPKCRDHDHLSGKYRGPAHKKCNLLYRRKLNIPVVFHNLKGYDAHFLMQVASKYLYDSSSSVIPNTGEKYMNFRIGKLNFIDSFAFCSSSLDSLVKNQTNFTHTKKFYTGDKLDLMTQKGVYPYEYIDSFNRFKETSLPPKEAFYSSLNQSGVSDDDYNRAQLVWKQMRIKTMKGYHDLYLKTDVLLLTDVMENFRAQMIRHYGLECYSYVSAPGMFWDAMLKKTDVKLELLNDVDMYLFMEDAKRGGMTQAVHRHAKANNPYMSSYKPTEKTSYLMYLDANNLYGCAMLDYLPSKGFKWLTEKRIKRLNTFSNEYIMRLLQRMGNCSSYEREGWFLEVDLKIPNSLHDHQNDMPLAPERGCVHGHELSAYQRQFKDINSTSCSKLLMTLKDKVHYKLHYRTLLYYLSQGAQLTHIHRVLSCNESKWMASYINYNTRQRAKATNTFEKDFFKLANNAVFGKTMENVRNHRKGVFVTKRRKAMRLNLSQLVEDIRIFSNEREGYYNYNTDTLTEEYLGHTENELLESIESQDIILKYIGQLTIERDNYNSGMGKCKYDNQRTSLTKDYKERVKDIRELMCSEIMTANPSLHIRRSNPELCLYLMKRSEVKLNKPIYVGAAILDLSKIIMYDFYYGHIKKTYGDKAQLVYMDTDSQILKIETEDIYKDMQRDREIYDTSNYPRDHPNFSEENKKVPGKWKDELGGKICTEVVALKAKCYGYTTDTGKTNIMCKGIQKCVKDKFTIDDMKDVLHDQKVIHCKVRGFRTINHKVYSIEQTKVGMNAYDDKRFLIDKISSRAYGHWRNV